MIKRTITVPAIPGLEIDNTSNQVKVNIDAPEPEEYGVSWWDQPIVRTSLPSTITIILETGAKIVLEPEVIRRFDCALQYREQVELESGRLYLVADRRQPNDKWVALCRYDHPRDEMLVEPIRGGGYPTIYEESKHNYTFYKEFDLDLKEYV